MPRPFHENLARYAELTIREGVNLQPGQELILAADIGDAEFVRLVVREAYRAGATNVFTVWSDEVVTLTRYQEGSDEAIGTVPQWFFDGQVQAFRKNAARLGISSGNPSLLRDVNADRVAIASKALGQATRELSEVIAGFQVNWCVVGAASPAWAAKVFPNLSADEALSKLWDAIFLTSRVLEDDPIQAWVSHCEQLESRVEFLNELRLDALDFRGPGTALRIGLVDGHLWAGGRGVARNGVQCSPNIPTEEVFTMPHRARTVGVVRSTKPLSVRGQIVEGIEVEFKEGAAVRVSATKGEETLRGLIATDEGACRLGEVALVPNSAAVSRSGVLFLNTLFDENAASHIALGRCYEENLPGVEALSVEDRLARGANDSLIHTDWMIGSDQIDVDGIHTDGSVTALMRAGEWVVR